MNATTAPKRPVTVYFTFPGNPAEDERWLEAAREGGREAFIVSVPKGLTLSDLLEALRKGGLRD